MQNTPPASLIWQASGSPAFPSSASGSCRTCGSTVSAGIPFAEWIKDTFTNLDLLTPGEIVCQACQFCFDDASVAVQARANKDKPQKFRNYSHFVLDGAWYPLSKGAKRQMRELLMQRPEVAVIADSGQKHLVFRAQTGWWLFEEQKLAPCPELLATLLAHIEPLYNAGANKTEIETGRYSQKTLLAILPTWREYDPALRPHRGSLSLQLALFLAQKDVTDDS